MADITMPAFVAGHFYPKDPGELGMMLKQMLGQTISPKLIPKAIIVPHAGYIYSGPVAATAYTLLESVKDKVKRVVIFAPAHRYPFVGIATTQVDAFSTPLGSIPVDKLGITQALTIDAVSVLDEAFFNEHALEVHLPFLQETLTDFSVAPFIVGDASYTDVAKVIEKLWGNDETLIVISSDLSHYYAAQQARMLDRKTADAILQLMPKAISDEQACGRIPIKGLLKVAKEKGLVPKLLDLRNSGDTAGSKDKVVGYGSFAFIK